MLDIDRKKKFQVKNLNEWLDQPEVSAAHPPLQVEHGEGHAVRGERGVPGDETQSRVVQSPLHSAQLYNCQVHLFSSIKISFAQLFQEIYVWEVEQCTQVLGRSVIFQLFRIEKCHCLFHD